ncbi:MAG: UDP-glucose 4-epimerase GalE [Acidobacteria bacterium]|nr:UDP-glucose 4-epimerase GalE [Chloroflexota bacterium]MYN64051.1 UDP-glucose 4-epimerase GalE [Acidobacteriota bacterium]
MTVLVTGAAGYIGSVVAERLLEHGHAVAALDDLSQGHRAVVPAEAGFFEGDLRDRARLAQVMLAVRPDAVAHLAAEALVGESMTEPAKFFEVNVTGGLNLLDAMRAAGVRRLVFSSTAAVYGEPEEIPIREDAPLRPVNAYGASKLAFERALPWYASAYGLRHVSLRYFNACGATVERGEHHVPETHLIAILLEVALGLRPEIRLFGSDYDTPDGTCIRDYVHVGDIADAHLLALDRIDRIESGAFNLGNGAGFSNREVVEAARRVTGHPIPAVATERRAGDPARLVASADQAREVLDWSPRYRTLDEMIATAWAWREDRLHPYAG